MTSVFHRHLAPLAIRLALAAAALAPVVAHSTSLATASVGPFPGDTVHGLYSATHSNTYGSASAGIFQSRVDFGMGASYYYSASMALDFRVYNIKPDTPLTFAFRISGGRLGQEHDHTFQMYGAGGVHGPDNQHASIEFVGLSYVDTPFGFAGSSQGYFSCTPGVTLCPALGWTGSGNRLFAATATFDPFDFGSLWHRIDADGRNLTASYSVSLVGVSMPATFWPLGGQLNGQSFDGATPYLEFGNGERLTITVPEPGTWAMLTAGLLAMALVARRRRI